MPVTPLAQCGGEDGTSCRPPFPGRPGLSQPCSQRFISDRCAATVLSRNESEHARPVGKMKPLFCTTSAPVKAVNNLGAKWLTGYSPVTGRPGGVMEIM